MLLAFKAVKLLFLALKEALFETHCYGHPAGGWPIQNVFMLE